MWPPYSDPWYGVALRETQNFSSTNFNMHRNEAVGSILLDPIGKFKAFLFSRDRSVSRLVPNDLILLACWYIALGGGGWFSYVRRFGILLFPDRPRFWRLIKCQISPIVWNERGQIWRIGSVSTSRSFPDFCDARRSFPTNENSKFLTSRTLESVGDGFRSLPIQLIVRLQSPYHK